MVRRWAWAIGLGLVIGAGAAGAQAQPKYEKAPTGEDMLTYYPSRAMDLGLPGAVTIDCLIKPDRTLTDCKVTRETPADLGFGAAALRLSKLFRMKEGALTDVRLTIPINFRLAP